MATIMCPVRRPQMATVRPGVFAAPELDSSRTGAIDEAPLDAGARSRVRTLAFERATSSSSIAQAKRLVVVGRGIGSKKNLPLDTHITKEQFRAMPLSQQAELYKTNPDLYKQLSGR